MTQITFRIHEILEEKGITVSEFSRLAGINYRTALDICNNQYKRVGLDTIAKICDALNVTPGELFLQTKS